MALTPKKKKFADEFLKCGNQSEAYRRAYNCKNMKPVTITEAASKLMRDYDVITRIKEQREKLNKSNIADAQEIQETLTKLIRGEIEEECISSLGKGNGVFEPIKVKKEISPKDRIKAGELLAKMSGAFNINLNVKDVPVIQDDI